MKSEVVVVGRIGSARAAQGTEAASATALSGTGARQALAAAHLGASVTLIGAAGTAPADHRALAVLRASNVALALETRPHDGARSETPQDVTAEAVLRHAPRIARAKVLLLQSEIPLDVSVRAARIARSHEVTTIMALTSHTPHAWKPQDRATFDLTTLTDAQAAEATGRTISTLREAEICAEALTLMGAPGIVIGPVPQGAAWKIGASQGHRAARLQGGSEPQAGQDSFNATLAVFVAQGCTPEQAIDLAVDAAALASQGPETPPRLSDLLAFRAHRATQPGTPQ